MHGMIFAELKRYVVTAFGPKGWNQLVEDAGATSKVYLPSQAYADEELLALVAAGSRISGKPIGELVEGFGEFIVPGLVDAYRAQINPTWKTMDLLEHTEETIHRVVRAKAPGATPPELKVERSSPDAVVVHYRSARKLCPLAKGIIRGVAKHFGEQIEIREPVCMLTGGAECTLQVRLV